ncbi:MAG: glycerophosphodiester phosphodiesterase [Candidatus Brocadiales bacterium]|nr:glycerophosphodiester phosphodiesterase [Candidatus Bathyanammoxibius amoris]
MKEKLIIAHRGASAHAKGNTIEAYQKAIMFGADMIETDIRKTKDNIFITYHDAHIQGTPIKELTYEEARKVAGSQGFDIPTLEDVLKYTIGKIQLDVELKEKGYEKELVGLLLTYLKKDEFVISSFNNSSLQIIKDNYPSIKVGLILEKDSHVNSTLSRRLEAFDTSKNTKPKVDFLVPHWKLLTHGLFERAMTNNIPIFIWTINDRSLIWTFLNDERVHGIITDKPDLAVSLRSQHTF